jgi:hypothetical protein
MLKLFYDTSTGTAPREQPAVVLLLEGGLVSWSLAMDKRGFATLPPFLVRQMSKWFYDTSTGTAPREQPAVVLLFGVGSNRTRCWL